MQFVRVIQGKCSFKIVDKIKHFNFPLCCSPPYNIFGTAPADEIWIASLCLLRTEANFLPSIYQNQTASPRILFLLLKKICEYLIQVMIISLFDLMSYTAQGPVLIWETEPSNSNSYKWKAIQTSTMTYSQYMSE